MRFSRSRTISRRIRLLHEYGKLVSKKLAMNVFGALVFLQDAEEPVSDSAAIWLPGGAWGGSCVSIHVAGLWGQSEGLW